MMRQIGKQILTMTFCLVLAGWAHADALVSMVVTDPLTGVAIDGYDPVSYFVDPQPAQGVPDYEYDWQGVPWYFESAANRDVFMRNPEIYAPQFGGHCLMSLSRGYLSDGKPRLYVVEALKLYFFYSTANRDAFLLSKAAAIDAATRNWPDLSKSLMGVRDEAPAADAEVSAEAGEDSSDASDAASGPPADSSMSTDTSAASVAPSEAASNVQPN